ncbi:Putative N-acetylgalactosaminyl-diphosphoundecaprenol glucuronosyltransferase [hydrothermal vent metagenome]|uniref:N-acetylgalactosaminyl-diphosphoundecaprenol glucuronosyltransferase n=1 Tax=hydrothermal vent metagenome TaxID=652676 RepID=A0A3B0ZF51_9ZZZZ
MPSISVIIPTYNRIETLPRAIESVLAQTHPVNELIIVDDGSTDGTAAWVAEHYPQIKLIEQQNSGVSAARNRGIEAASGEWIALLDSDDEWLPKKLEKQLACLKSEPALKIIHSDEIWIRNGVRVNQMRKHSKKGGWIFQDCLPLCAISPSAVMIHRSIFDDVGLFDESLPACEDYDLWLRITSVYPVLYYDEPLIQKYGGHEDQLSRKHWGMDRFRIKALVGILEAGGLNESDYAAALEMMLGKAKVVLGGARKRNNDDVIAAYEALIARWR